MTGQETILIAEDDADDRFLLAEAFKAAKIGNPLRMVNDGREAKEYLAGEGSYPDRRGNPLPFLLLLDLKMPLMDGFQLLEWMRGQEGLRRLPVIVLTSSLHPADVQKAYRLGANSFLLKPSTLPNLIRLLTALKGYWMEFNQFPAVGTADAAPAP